MQALADIRAEAILHKDEPAFMATVDPEAPETFRESQRRQLRGLSSLPLSSYRLEIHTEETGDLAGATALLYQGASRRFLPETRQRWAISEADTVPALDRLWLSYVERDGRWYVAGDSDLADLGLTTPLGLWESGPVVVQRTSRTAILSHPSEAGRALTLAQLAEQAIDRVGSWDWPGHIVMVLPSTPKELETILRTTLDVTKFVAFVSYDAERTPTYRASGPRMYVQDQNLAKYSARFQLETLVHEMVHAAAAPSGGPFIPSWVHEGVADWIATGMRTGERRPAGSDGALPRDDEFSAGPQSSIITAYGEGRSAVSYLARRSGVSAPIAFFKALGSLRVEPGSQTYLSDRALRSATGGLDLAGLQKGWGGR